MKRLTSGGGWPAIRYALAKARQGGGLWKFWKTLRSKNACKTCALGMGGQRGGMVNEAGHFPEVCKKSLQAMIADMQGAIEPRFWSSYSIDELRGFSPRELEACGRLTQPLLLADGDSHYAPISWDTAVAEIADTLRRTGANQTFWYTSGRSSNEAAFLVQLFARLYGTNNVNNCSYYCHQASGVGLTSVVGSGAGTVMLEDVECADLVVLLGANPASNHPRLMRSLMTVRRRGGEVIVINPVVETGLVNFRVPSDPRSLLFGSAIASLYIQPDIGGDLALIMGIAKRIVELRAIDETFLNEHCHGWPTLLNHLRHLSWEEIERKGGVSYDDIDQIAARYAKAKRAIFAWTMGITHHVHGVQSVQAIANLALLRGMVGRPGAGLLPIRGHSNVQGIGTMGVTPRLKDIVLERLESHFGVTLPHEPGLDTFSCLEAAHAGRIKVGISLGGNLYGASPDARFTADALAKLDLLVYLNTTLNSGHAIGLARRTIVLPVLARDEEPQPTTQESMFSFVRLSDGGPRRHEGPRSEVEIVADLALRVLGDHGPLKWNEMRNTHRIREHIARIIPGLEQLADIDRTKQEFHIPGRTFREPRFATQDGRAKLHVVELPDLAGGEGQLRLMTVRSEGQFNTVVYEDEDVYRGQERRDVILLHPTDMAQQGFAADERVTVHSECGCLNNVLVRPFEQIKPGNALMYYPEANKLVPRRLDPASRTPAFKNVLVRLDRSLQKSGDKGDTAAEPLVQISGAGESSRESMRAC